MLRQMRPSRFEDIIALVSLYRPGPDGQYSGLSFGQGSGAKAGLSCTRSCKPITLEETYGIMIYQEQVMQAAQVLAGYTLGGADLAAPRDG
jgi:DNA polymerase-3 subunit alpha